MKWLSACRCFFHGCEPEVIGKPFPYPRGIDNPFTSTNIGWGRAWEVPVRCKRCGHEYTLHGSSPELLQRYATFYWSATESNIPLVSRITKKLNALTPDRLEIAFSCIDQISLQCGVCGFETQDADEYREHIIEEHQDVLQADVLRNVLRRYGLVEV